MVPRRAPVAEDLVVDAELARLHQVHHVDRGDGLRHAGHPEAVLGVDLLAGRRVGVAVALGEHQPLVLGDRHRQAGDGVLLHVGLDRGVDRRQVRPGDAFRLPDGGVAGAGGDAVAAHPRQPVALVPGVVELALVLGRRHQVAGRPGRAGRLVPDGGVAVLAADAVAADLDQPEALAHERVELGLVLGRGHPVAGGPRRSRRLAPDGGVAVLAADLVAADQHQAEALAQVLVELGLVLGRRHAVAGDPSRTGGLVPDGGVAVLAVDGVAADLHQPEALAHVLVELGLVLGRGHPVAGDPPGAGRLLPDGGVAVAAAHRVAVDMDQAEALTDQLVELHLVLVGRQPVSGRPCGRHRHQPPRVGLCHQGSPEGREIQWVE